MHDQPIGVFDSGIGGLAVVRAMRALDITVPIVYLADAARVPYGEKSPETVRQYARECAQFFTTHDVGLLVAACNTVSAVAFDVVREVFLGPVIGTLSPSAAAAVRATRSRAIGILGTPRTVSSGAYEAALRAHAADLRIVAQACPELVADLEMGHEGDRGITAHIDACLEPFRTRCPDMDTLILGCTHYAFLRDQLTARAAAFLGHPVTIVDSAEETAREVRRTLSGHHTGDNSTTYWSTDVPHFTHAATAQGFSVSAPVQHAVLSSPFKEGV